MRVCRRDPVTVAVLALFSVILFVILLFPNGAWAASTPDLVSLGVGRYDSIEFNPSADTPRHMSLDMRLEYRFGYSLLPLVEPYAWIHPWAGVEANVDGMMYGAAGFLADIPLDPVILTPSFGVGAYRDGGSKYLGSVVEFRSMIEVGYQLDNGMRLSGFLSHTSNGGITRKNPGVNTAGLYLHIPVSFLTNGGEPARP